MRNLLEPQCFAQCRREGQEFAHASIVVLGHRAQYKTSDQLRLGEIMSTLQTGIRPHASSRESKRHPGNQHQTGLFCILHAHAYTNATQWFLQSSVTPMPAIVGIEGAYCHAPLMPVLNHSLQIV